MKAIWILLICSSSIAHAETASNLVVTPSLINGLAERMRTNHPALKAESHKIEAARLGLAAIRTWEDPMVMLGAMGARTMMREDDGDMIYGVEQKLPLFGKPAQERKVASAELQAVQMSADAKFQELRRELARALFKSALSDETVRLLESDLAWLETSHHIAQDQYIAGEGSQLAVLKLQTELEKRKASIQTEKEAGQQNQAVVRRFLNESTFSFSQPLNLPQLASEIPYSQRLISLALKFEPELRVMHKERAAAEAEAELTRKERLPEFAVGAEARNYSGDGSFRQGMLTVTFSVPLGNRSKYKAAYKRDLEKVSAIDQQITDKEQGVVTEIRGIITRIAAARREALLYRDKLIPQAELALHSLQAGWEQNRGMLNDLLETRRMLVDSKLMYARAVAEQFDMIAELILCCGIADLEALEMVIPPPEKKEIQP